MLFKCFAEVTILDENLYDIWAGEYKDQAEATDAAYKRAIELQGYLWDDMEQKIPGFLNWNVVAQTE